MSPKTVIQASAQPATFQAENHETQISPSTTDARPNTTDMLVPPRTISLMDLPTEIRVRIYNFVLPAELSMFDSVHDKSTDFRSLFTTSHSIRSEMLRYCFLQRTLHFNLLASSWGRGGELHFCIGSLRRDISWLTTVISEAIGPCGMILVTLLPYVQYEIFDDPPLLSKLWKQFCGLLPPATAFKAQVVLYTTVTSRPNGTYYFTNPAAECEFFFKRGGVRESPWVIDALKSIQGLTECKVEFICNGSKVNPHRLNEEANEFLNKWQENPPEKDEEERDSWSFFTVYPIISDSSDSEDSCVEESLSGPEDGENRQEEGSDSG